MENISRSRETWSRLQLPQRPLAEFLDDFFPSIDGVIKRREMGSLERHIGPWVYITDIMAELATEREEAELDSDSQP